MERKSILIFSGSFFLISETFIFRQVAGLREKYDVTLLGYEFVNHDKYDFESLKRIRLNPYRNLFDRGLTLFFRKILRADLKLSLGNAFLLPRELSRIGLDVIHAHFGWSCLSILPVARKAGIPLVVSFHGFDASAALRDTRYRDKLPALFEYADAIVICSSHMFENLQLERWRNKVYIVPYGVDSDEFAPVRPSNGGGQFRLLHSGRLVEKKGVVDLIKVFKLLTETHVGILLDIIGDGPEKALCERTARELGISDRVFFHGAQPQPVVKRFISHCDIFVLNSRTDDNGDMEGLPNSILESMAMEKTVVSTYHAGIPGVIENGYNGFLVPERNNSELFRVLDELICNDTLRQRAAQNARKTILKSYTKESMNRKLVEIFDNLNLTRRK